MCTIFASESLKGRWRSEDPAADCRLRMSRMDLREIGLEGVNWIRLTQDMNKWRALVNTVMNLRVP